MLPAPLRSFATNWGLPFATAQAQTRATDQAKDANEQRYQQALAEMRGLRSYMMGGYGDLESRQRAELGRLQGSIMGRMAGDLTASQREFQQLRNPLLAGYRGTEQDVMGLMRGMGATEREDVNRRYNALGSQQLADLQARGLGTTTLRQGVQQGVERGRTRELGALEERLRTQQAGALQALRGATLGAQERLGALGLGIGQAGRAGLTQAAAGFGQQGLGLGAQYGLGRLGAYADTTRDMVNLIASRQDLYPPDQSQLMYGFGRASTPMPQGPEWWQGLPGASIGAAGNIFGGYLAGR